jgi:KipI family sensor histidine kinase inhibitor
VRALEFLIQQKALAGVVETVPSFRSLLVYYDPRLVEYEALCAGIAELVPRADTSVLPPARTVELPCCYDPELGLDLAAAAARLGLGLDDLIRTHSEAEYLVYFIGFTPGLPYMNMPERLRIPRLDTPRTRVPAGSVGIGGAQCCVYSVESPGGYWILGRTPLRLYDPDAAEPTLLRPGDRVRFRPISSLEWASALEGASAAPSNTTPRISCAGEAGARTGPTLRILDPGAQTTVQDLGRRGQLRYGIPPSGPVDPGAFVVANRLVGNADGAAALECTVLGPRFEVGAPCAIAVTGAEIPITVNGQEAPGWTTVPLAAGDVVKLGAARTGVRAYVAFSGGIDVPAVLGSRSTYLRGRLGGLEGRALRREDVLPLAPAAVPVVRRVPLEARPDRGAEPEIRVVLGPQDDRFDRAGLEALLTGPFEMLPQSDRMGARLRGPRIAHNHGHDIISDGIALGSIQVPGDGQPIVLLVDRQSTGGYTKVATVCSFDIGRLGQVKPGQRVRFRAITLAEAHRTLREGPGGLERVLGPGMEA